MSLTKINCFTYNNPLSSKLSSNVTLNPLKKPGSFVMALSSPATSSLGAKVATKLALDHFVEGVLNYTSSIDNFDSRSLSHNIVAQGFKNANRSVYDFGHKLSAGGRMKACLTTLAVANGVVSVAKVGNGNVYLHRDKNIYSFFDDNSNSFDNVGENSRVSVEFSDIDLEKGDKVILFSRKLTNMECDTLKRFLNKVDEFNQTILEKMILKLRDRGGILDDVMISEFGGDSILLENPINEAVWFLDI